jgi:hypothetical protein
MAESESLRTQKAVADPGPLRDRHGEEGESMKFKYACFISYCHGQRELVKSFMDQFKKALHDEIDAIMDEETTSMKSACAPVTRTTKS